MKYFLITMAVFTLSLVLRGQGNFVPNNSFEIYSSCPIATGQIYLATGWKSPTQASPDYLSSCCNPTVLGVPNNAFGSQATHSGNGYVGEAIYGGSYREYIQVKLTDSLISGKMYCVNYYVSLAGFSEFASIPPQGYFSTDSIWNNSTTNFNYTPQITSTNIIYDTTNWVIISGEFIANGRERYLTIGNFYDVLNTRYDTVNNSPFANPYSYFYIDDVSVYEKINSDAGNDKTICIGDSILIGSSIENGIIYRWNTSLWLSDSAVAQPWAKPLQTTTYYLTISDTGGLYCAGKIVDTLTITVDSCTVPPQFFVPTILKGDEVFSISALPPNTSFELFDERGRLIYKKENYQNDFSVINLSAGVYLYQLKFSDNTYLKGKFCAVK